MGAHPGGSSRITGAVVTGGMIAATNLLVDISFAAFVFSGPLAGHVGQGIGYFLFGSAVVALVVSIGSAFPHAVANVQDAPTVVLAAAAAAVAVAVPADPPTAFATVMVMIALATGTAAAVFFALGRFRLANLVRYIPYPVVGGFLAGTGWLLLAGGFSVVTGRDVTAATLAPLVQPALATRWFPALAIALVATVAVRRGAGPLALPALLLVTIAVFHAVVAATGTPIVEARADGWLLGPFPDAALWSPPTPTILLDARWDVIAANAGTLGTLLVIAVLDLLLNLSGMELATNRDVDVNRELRLAGIGNVLAGLGGGAVGYHTLSLTTLSHRLSPHGRLTSRVVVALYVAVIVGGAAALEHVPTMLPGAMLMFLGLHFLIAWLYDARGRMTRGERVIIVVITTTMALLGVLEAVALGIGLAMALFFVEYSRGSPVRRATTARELRSNVDRPPAQRAALRDHGDEVLVFELHRFIFFGTANRLHDTVRTDLRRSDGTVRHLVIDFRRVTGLDASAGSSFVKIGQLAAAREIGVVLCGLTPRMRSQLDAQTDPAGDGAWRVATDLDHALEWCEAQVLARVAADAGPEPDPRGDALDDLMAHMAPQTVPAGATLIAEGQPAGGLYYLREGNLTAQIDRDGGVVRLRKMRPGVFVGELSLYADAPASASVVADEPSTVLFLSAEDLAQLERDDPATAAVIHRLIAQLVSERLLDATTALSALR